MVYPTTGLPVTVEIAPGAQLTTDPGTWPWVDVTGYWRQAVGITYEEGRGDWGQAVDAGSCSLTFDNTAGHFSQYNPAGQWFGRLGRDTPLRVRLRRGEDSFGRTVPNGGWDTADSGQTWTTAGGSATSDYFVNPGAGKHVVAVTNSSRNTLLGVDLVDVTVTTTATVPALATGAAIVPGVTARWQNAGDAYLCELRCEPGGAVTLQLRKIVGGVFTTIRAAVTIPGLTHTAGKTYGIEFRCVGDQLQARAWDAAGAKPTAWHAEATDTSHAGRSGAVGCRSLLATGNTNTPPVVLSYGSFAVTVDMVGGYVPAWVPRWDKSANDRWVEVTAKGALYRLQPGTGKAPQRSPLRRSVGASALAYWPMEEGAGADFAAAAVAGHPPMSVSDQALTFADVSAVVDGGQGAAGYGTKRLANLANGARLTAPVPPSVTAATAAGWSAAAAFQLWETLQVTGDPVVLELETPGGTFTRWRLLYQVGSPSTFGVFLKGYNAAGAETVLYDGSGSSITTSFHLTNFSVWQSGGNINWGVRWNGSTWREGSGSTPGTLTGVTRISANTLGAKSAIPLPFGHLALWAGWPLPAIAGAGVADGFAAYPGSCFGPDLSWLHEPAHLRLARLGREDGLTVTMPTVDARGAARMGLQPIEAPLELYRQAEQVDGGTLYERPFGLAYQPRAARYNQTPALILNAAGDLAEPPVPDPDGQTYRNRITVNRSEGSSAVAELPEVTAGAALVYDESVDLAVATDGVLPGQAGWRLHLASGTAMRWPRLDLNMAATPALIDAWLNCRPGSRVQAINPPADVAGQDVDVILEGHTTKLGYKDWDVSATFSPAAPWDVATVGGEQRVCVTGATLNAAVTAAATALVVLSPEPWTTAPGSYPLLLNVGGEKVRATAAPTVAPSGANFLVTFAAVVRGLNVPALAHPAGAGVDVWAPAIIAL